MPDNPEALHHKPQRWLKPAAIAGVGLATLIVAIGAFSRVTASQDLKTWTAQEAIPTVDIIRPSTQSVGQDLVLPGQVDANYDAVIHARVSGYLKKWYVDIGAKVKTGQLLAEIDTPELDQQLLQAKADLATAVANQKLAALTAQRWTNLLKQDAVSHQETDEKTGDLQAKDALVQAAQANVDRLEALEAFRRIKAPFDGVVTARNTDIGQLITAGQANDPGLFTVADVHRLRIYVDVPQTQSAGIRPGEAAALTVPEYPNRTFQATLTSNSGAVGAQSGAVQVELQMDNPDGALKPGDYAQVTFNEAPTAGVVQVPASAVMFRHKGMAVAVVQPDSHVAIKYVSVQRDLGTTIELAGGLSPNDRVIDNPPDSISQGELVRVSGASSAAAAGEG
ncbi:MAG TPA: efflux RND transporter periplasmic adaptor subunit [Caulobacteraceae bacterium]|nr:efflux RND transporter periplasmic adaptor subunit [Caulobacteraceae bacterium]